MSAQRWEVAGAGRSLMEVRKGGPALAPSLGGGARAPRAPADRFSSAGEGSGEEEEGDQRGTREGAHADTWRQRAGAAALDPAPELRSC